MRKRSMTALVASLLLLTACTAPAEKAEGQVPAADAEATDFQERADPAPESPNRLPDLDVSGLEETMPETDKVVALADIFGVTTDYLLRLQPEQTEPEEKQPPPQERKDWVERFLAFSKRKWYLLGWVLIAWGVLDLVQLALFYLAYRGMLGGFTGLIGWDMAEMGGVNLLDVFPAGVLLFPALYAAVKIAAGVLVLYFGKRHVQKKREEEMQ